MITKMTGTYKGFISSLEEMSSLESDIIVEVVYEFVDSDSSKDGVDAIDMTNQLLESRKMREAIFTLKHIYEDRLQLWEDKKEHKGE
jgi:hypothetical protein